MEHTNNRPRMSAEYFFLSLGVLVTLITSVTSFLNLIFETLNRRFPDVLNASYQYGYGTYQYEGMRTALATLVIFFPVYLIVSYYWRKYSERGLLGPVDEIIRKWTIYIILFLASVLAVVDLVALVRYFISGEITTRFIFKVLAVLATVLIVGSYYITLKRRAVLPDRIGFTFGGGALALVAIAIIYSFTVMGSPMKQRQLRLDDRRINDLQSIQWQVINYWQQKEKLPAKLEDLTNPLSGYSLPVPPEFEKGEQYEYAVKGPRTFELCATFSQPMPKGWQEYGGVRPYPVFDMGMGGGVAYPSKPGYGINESWDHDAGRTCYERTIDPEMFPPFPEPTR